MGAAARRDLARLEALRLVFGPAAARERRARLGRLARATLGSSRDVLRLHEAALFARAYPDDAGVRDAAESLLRGFATRADVRRFRRALENSGLAGTDVRFRFFAETAMRLAQRYPASLEFDWNEVENADAIEALLPVVASASETAALDAWSYGARGWLRRLKGSWRGDAAWFYAHLADHDVRVALPMLEALDLPCVLRTGAGMPSRTLERGPRSLPFAVDEGLPRERVDLRASAAARLLEQRCPAGEGRRWVELARDAMVVRARDLDAFVHASEHDVSVFTRGGAELVLLGVRPEDRFALESLFGYLLIRNAVPVGYGTIIALNESAELNFNVFDTFRGAEAAALYALVVAVARQVMGARTMIVDGYQLGADNPEAIASGAWWFYRKLGFEPLNDDARRLARSEDARLARRPGARSTPAMLRKLARSPMTITLDGAPPADGLQAIETARVSLFVSRWLAGWRSRREQGPLHASARARRRLGLRTAGVGHAPSSASWAPMILALPGLERWSRSEKRALAEIARLKGGTSEREFVRAYDAHPKLRRLIARIAHTTKP